MAGLLLHPIQARAYELEDQDWQVQRTMKGIYEDLDATWFAWDISNVKMFRMDGYELLEFNYVLVPDEG